MAKPKGLAALVGGALAATLGATQPSVAQDAAVEPVTGGAPHCDSIVVPTRDLRTTPNLEEADIQLAAGLASGDNEARDGGIVLIYWGHTPANEAEVNRGACDAFVEGGAPVKGIILADERLVSNDGSVDGREWVSVVAGADVIREFPIDGRPLREATKDAVEYANRVVYEPIDVASADARPGGQD